MHVGIDISRVAVAERTGTEHYTYELLAALARRDRSRRYTLYCNRLPQSLPPLGPNMVLRRIPLPRLWTHARLSAEILARPPDVLFVPAHVLPLGTPLARRTRAVVTVHDLGYLRFPEAHTRSQRLLLRMTTVWSARVAHRVIAISQATKADLVRMAGVSAEKVSVVYHGVAGRFGAGQESGVRSQESAAGGQGAPYLLYVGTIQPRKNLERLIEAFAKVVNRSTATSLPTFQLSNLQLLLAGRRGWLAEGIERRAADLGVADRVRFLGYVPDEKLPALLGGALAFVFPSLYEGFGMPVLEAMACGAPVLTSSTSSLPEVAGDAALLVDPHSVESIAAGIARLASDPALREELRRKGLARAATFTWDRCAEETLAVLSIR